MDISRVIIFTRDVERLAGFYKACFGLSGVGECTADWAELSAGGCSIAFHRIDEAGESRDGWIKIVFGSSDVAAEKQRLERLGVEMSGLVQFGEIQLCDGLDPDGNRFQVSSRGL
jgi:predicted enzyme related to lactoylglutathione lyase